MPDADAITQLAQRTRFVLVRTSHPGNIGGAARAMKTMGLARLHLVAPLKFPHAEATARASGADDLLEHARVFATLDEAIADCTLVIGASARQRTLPKGMNDALMTVHAKHPFPDTPEEIAAIAALVRDPNFRVQISPQGLHVYNRDGLRLAQDAFALWPQLGLEDDAAHAFYMGVELARAQIAWQLGKRYVQDQPLDWGVAVERPADDLAAWCAPGTTMTNKNR